MTEPGQQRIEVRTDSPASLSNDNIFCCPLVGFHLHHITSVLLGNVWYQPNDSLDFDAFNNQCISIILRSESFRLLYISLIHLVMFSRAHTSKEQDPGRDYVKEVYVVITRHGAVNEMTAHRLGAKMRVAFHIVSHRELCDKYLENEFVKITDIYQVTKKVLSDDTLLHQLLEKAVCYFEAQQKRMSATQLKQLALSLVAGSEAAISHSRIPVVNSLPDTVAEVISSIDGWDERRGKYVVKLRNHPRRVKRTEEKILRATNGREELVRFRSTQRKEGASGTSGDENVDGGGQAEVEMAAESNSQEGVEDEEEEEEKDKEDREEAAPENRGAESVGLASTVEVIDAAELGMLHLSIDDGMAIALADGRQEGDHLGVRADHFTEAVSRVAAVSPEASPLTLEQEASELDDVVQGVKLDQDEGYTSPRHQEEKDVEKNDDVMQAHERPQPSSTESEDDSSSTSTSHQVGYVTPPRPKRQRLDINYNVTARQRRIDRSGVLTRRERSRGTRVRIITPEQREMSNKRRRVTVGLLRQNLAIAQQLLLQEQAAKVQLEAQVMHSILLMQLLTPEQALLLSQGRLRFQPVEPVAIESEAAALAQRVLDESMLASQALLQPFGDDTRLLDEREVSKLLNCNIAEAAMDTSILLCGPWPQLVDLLPSDLLTSRRRAVSIVNTFTGTVETRHWMAVLFELSTAEARVSFLDSSSANQHATEIVASTESALRSRFPGQSWSVNFVYLGLQSDAYNCGIYAVDVCRQFASRGVVPDSNHVLCEGAHEHRRRYSSQLYPPAAELSPATPGQQIEFVPLPAWISTAFKRVPRARSWDWQTDEDLPTYLVDHCSADNESFSPVEDHVMVNSGLLKQTLNEPTMYATHRAFDQVPRVLDAQEMNALVVACRTFYPRCCHWRELEMHVPEMLNSSRNSAIVVDTQTDNNLAPHWVPALFYPRRMKVAFLDSLQQNASSQQVLGFTRQVLLGLSPTQSWTVQYLCLNLSVVEHDCGVYAMYICEYFVRCQELPGANMMLPAEGLHRQRRIYSARVYEFDAWTMERGIDYLVNTQDARSMLFYPSVQPVNDCNLHLDVPCIRQAFEGENREVINASLVLQALDGHYILVLFRLRHQQFLHALVWDPLADVDACRVAINRMQDQLCTFIPNTAFTFRGKLRRTLRHPHETGVWVLEVLRRWSDAHMKLYRDEDVCPRLDGDERCAWLEKLEYV